MFISSPLFYNASSSSGEFVSARYTTPVAVISFIRQSIAFRNLLNSDDLLKNATSANCGRKDYRIGTLSKVNNIIYCKNDVLAE